MIISDAALPRAEQLTRQLQKAVARLGWETNNVPGYLSCTDGVVVDLGDIAITMDEILVPMRTLEKEVLRQADQAAVELAIDTTTEGKVVLGLTSLRDVAVHRTDLVHPNTERVLGPLPGGRHFVARPTWKAAVELPSDTFLRDADKSGARYHYKTREAAYVAHIAGRTLIDTAMDVLKFVLDLAPSLAANDQDDPSQLRYLPLAPSPLLEASGAYQRLHPSWPNERDLEGELRVKVKAHPPSCTGRLVTHAFVDDQGITVLGGYTIKGENFLDLFTEPEQQVAADIKMGYPYWLARLASDTSSALVAGEPLVTTDEGALMGLDRIPTAADAVTDVDLPTYQFHWHLARSDVFKYRAQRNLA